jgi:hypothetical protein
MGENIEKNISRVFEAAQIRLVRAAELPAQPAARTPRI